MQTAQRRPDGTFGYGDEIYRLEDGERDHFVVRRLRDDKVVGGLHFLGDHCEVRAEGDVGEDLPVIQAIGRLLEGPRGLLPLQ